MYTARAPRNQKLIMNPCQNSLLLNKTFWLRCVMLLTTAHLWLSNSKSKAYLHLILQKEAIGLCVSGWKVLNFYGIVYGNQLQICLSKKENRLPLFDLSSNASSIFTADYPYSSASMRQCYTNASSMGEEMVGLLPFYLCCTNIQGFDCHVCSYR